jgi:predicted porin
MKKSLIALAVAGAFVAPAIALADAKIGGEIDVTAQSFNNGSKSGLMLNNTHTRWWLDNADDIGGGNKMLAHFEMDQAASGASGINNRNSFIGIQGGFGLIKMGTEEGIYEQLGYQVDAYHGAAGPAGNIVNGLGTWGSTTTGAGGAATGKADGSGTDTGNHICGAENLGCRRVGGTISYVSPDMNGLNFKLDYSVNGPAASASSNNATTIQAGGYWAGNAGGTGIRVGLGTIQVKNSGLIGAAGTSETDTGMRFTIGATFGDFMVDALLEQNKWKNDAAGLEIKANHLWLQGVYNLPTGKVIVDVMKLGKTKLNGGDQADTDGKHFGVGYYHNLSKASALYVIYSKIDNKDQAKFGMQEGAAAAVGKDPSSIGVGLYTTF